MKKIIVLILIVLVIAGGYFWFFKSESVDKTPAEITSGQWEWIYTELQDGKVLSAPQGGRFVLTFGVNGSVNSSTDCNFLSGNYVKDGEVLSFTPFVSTKMYCEGSLESQYTQQLSLTNSHTISEDTLRLILNRDFGVMTFVKK